VFALLKLADVSQLGMGLADKSIGLVFEAAGTIAGSERLKEAGRARQEAGSERLMAVEEDLKSTSRAAEAEAQERRQKQHQPVDRRSSGTSFGDQDSPASGAAEKVKGLAKQGLGKVAGNDEMKAEGEAQQDKAEAQTQSAKHEAKAEFHKKKAEGALKQSDAKR
jgi:uncharacterized protein YjbJ (UPF0337 family)